MDSSNMCTSRNSIVVFHFVEIFLYISTNGLLIECFASVGTSAHSLRVVYAFIHQDHKS